MHFVSVLTLIFIVLKLCAVNPIAGWSWIWILAPTWIPMLISLPLLIMFVVRKVWHNNRRPYRKDWL